MTVAGVFAFAFAFVSAAPGAVRQAWGAALFCIQTTKTITERWFHDDSAKALGVVNTTNGLKQALLLSGQALVLLLPPLGIGIYTSHLMRK